ncbi:hypothetical protein Q7P35_007371 [Cladosporium inversicolor]
MVKKPPKPPTPADLREARESPKGEELRDAHTYCHELSCYGSRDDYHWGFRIYRTTHPPSCPDKDFSRAIQVLNEFIRYSCFEDLTYDSSGTITDISSGADAIATNDNPEQALWRRLRKIFYRINNSSMQRRSPKSDPLRKHGSDFVAPKSPNPPATASS